MLFIQVMESKVLRGKEFFEQAINFLKVGK